MLMKSVMLYVTKEKNIIDADDLFLCVIFPVRFCALVHVITLFRINVDGSHERPFHYDLWLTDRNSSNDTIYDYGGQVRTKWKIKRESGLVIWYREYMILKYYFWVIHFPICIISYIRGDKINIVIHSKVISVLDYDLM